jgi:hypothetical protein
MTSTQIEDERAARLERNRLCARECRQRKKGRDWENNQLISELREEIAAQAGTIQRLEAHIGTFQRRESLDPVGAGVVAGARPGAGAPPKSGRAGTSRKKKRPCPLAGEATPPAKNGRTADAPSILLHRTFAPLPDGAHANTLHTIMHHEEHVRTDQDQAADFGHDHFEHVHPREHAQNTDQHQQDADHGVDEG